VLLILRGTPHKSPHSRIRYVLGAVRSLAS
jgi:hypothetical protein